MGFSVLSVFSVSLWCICFSTGEWGGWGKTRQEKFVADGIAPTPTPRVEDVAMTWSVKDGRLYCGRDQVGVRRVVVEMVVGRQEGEVAEEKARHMIRMERALSLRGLSQSLRQENP